MLVWPTDRRPESIAFISDLHLFSTRSTAERHRESILRAAREAEMVVLGGDLFDFRWSRVGDFDATARAAANWLMKFAAEAGDRQYVYLFGNHDGDTLHQSLLHKWAAERPHFTVAGDLLRVDDMVFLHGDAVEGSNDAAGLQEYRKRWAGKPQATLVQSHAYDAAISTGAHRIVAAVAHRRRRTFAKLLRYLDQHQCGLESGVRNVVFGHTHRFIPGLSYGGVRFYNPGATVRGVPFKPVLLRNGQSWS